MILLYQLPEGPKAAVVPAFLERIGKQYVQVDESAASLSPRDAFAGRAKGSSPNAPGDSAIFFSPEEQEDDARHILELLSQAGIRFRHQVLLTEDLMERPLKDIIQEQLDHQVFLKKLRHLQELIDGCGQLREEDYDPDRWSEMKFAIADANDCLDALVGEDEKQAAQARDALEARTEALKKHMERLLTYKPS